MSQSLLPEVEAYIRGQREHHRVKTFEEEYRALLDRHAIQYDPRYVFDGENVARIKASLRDALILARPSVG